MGHRTLIVCDNCAESADMPEKGGLEGWGVVKVSVARAPAKPEEGTPNTGGDPTPRLQAKPPRELCPRCIDAVLAAAGLSKEA
jgi:hypothetical protein